MFICKFCEKEFVKETALFNHIKVSSAKEKIETHPSLPCYLADHSDKKEFSKENLTRMYSREMKSTPMIAEELQINKPLLLKIMHHHNIPLRNLSEATKNQIKRDGLWNKGKTKHDHPSIMKIAKKRLGKNNPYYTAPGFKERHRKNRALLRRIQRQSCLVGTPKSTEQRMITILDKMKVQYVRNFRIKYPGGTWRLYDFLVENTLVIEMQGNYYHANPRMYGPDDEIVIAKKIQKAKDIWDYDADKEKLAIQSGYKYLAIWEDEFSDTNNRCVENILCRAL